MGEASRERLLAGLRISGRCGGRSRRINLFQAQEWAVSSRGASVSGSSGGFRPTLTTTAVCVVVGLYHIHDAAGLDPVRWTPESLEASLPRRGPHVEEDRVALPRGVQ